MVGTFTGRSSSSNEKKVGKKGKRGGSGEHKVTHSSKLLEVSTVCRSLYYVQYIYTNIFNRTKYK